ncbi:hypothetical protein [Allobranchiibius sp. GilTou73]|uniref:hypothetical protein n=1 Tax=Allobranchiibius sp. GilTou73 TaxID=2904523 RepID=UPI001F415ED7|nr:hypothetical protein [Allobranchiibius sp. GilTou73]UIJ33334.1 hypothetical protein LVQ62_08995 [Allobranchiibius sp. GilTou73]
MAPEGETGEGSAQRTGRGGLWYVAVLLAAAVVVLAIQALLTIAYVGLSGDHAGRGPKVLVVSADRGVAGGIANRLNALDGHPLRAFVASDRAAAESELADGDASAVFVFTPDQPSDAILTDSAAGAADAAASTAILRADEAAQGRAAAVRDVAPTQPGDPRGQVSGYLVLCQSVSGFLIAAAFGAWLHGRRAGFSRLRRTLLAAIVFSLGSGAFGAWLVLSVTRSLSAPWLPLALAGALVAGVSAVLTFAAIGVFGPGGAVLPALMLATFSGPYAASDASLPAITRAVVHQLPGGAGVDLVRDVVYFHRDHALRPAGTLGWWLLGGLLVMFLAGANARRVGDPPPDPAQ